MRFFVGTSGFSYKEWKGSFYPEKLPAKEMLGYYAARFSAVALPATGGTLPSKGARRAVVTPGALMRPSRMAPSDEAVLSIISLTWPPSRSAIAGPEPL